MTTEHQQALLRRHRALNASTADAWQTYATHRQHVMAHLAATRATGHLGVLGAGNCNDLDLRSLTGQFANITLLDCDKQSILAGVERQHMAKSSSIQVRAPVNFAGLQPAVGPSGSLSDIARRHARERAKVLGGAEYDCVASTCVLSQILLSLVEQIGEDHPRCLQLVQLERAMHLQLLCELVRPGGQVVLISDLVSTDTAPELASTPGDRLPALMLELLGAHNFFTGMNPYLIARWLQTDPSIAPRTTDVKLLRPWIWHVSARRAYLVFAIRFTCLPA